MMMELVGGRELWLSILRRGEPVLQNVAYVTYVSHEEKKKYLGIWRADWVFRAPESTVNNVK
jgi:hypothetical protein